MNNKQILIYPKQIVSADNNNTIYRNKVLEIINGRIVNILDYSSELVNNYEGEVYNYPNLTLIPGFIQTHIHLCQTLFRGLADDLELLDWLQKKIFPFEHAHNKASLAVSAKLGIYELQTGGTTTILDMGTINNEEVVFENLINSNMRGFSGKCMVDRNDLFPSFKESTEESLSSSYLLAKTYHNANNGKLKYGFAPRFVLSCSEDLLRETFEMSKDFTGSLYHSHTSENKDEVEAVRKLSGMENIEYFNSMGVLSDHTILAHGIHVSKTEREILKNTGTRIVHCPSANLKLGSGIADIPKYLETGVSISLGADGPPCNNNLSMFVEMRLAALIQKPIYGSTAMDAKTVFRLGTIEGAKALHIDNEVGSIEIGKKADLVLLDFDRANQSLLDDDESIYSNIVYSANRNNVRGVMIDGEWVVIDGESLNYDEDELVYEGKKQLNELISRANI